MEKTMGTKQKQQKNLFLLPTDKPSRLSDCHNDKLHLDDVRYLRSYQNIYITSDEEIKDGDWVLKCKNVNDWNFKSGELEEKDYSYFSVKCVSLALINLEDKKIILTTDQDLIKDGVQAIDDEFLESFVKNPSCEEVEVVKGFPDGTNYGYNFLDYQIIIPKEEPKQECLITKSMQMDAKIAYDLLPKQETLEEVAEKSAIEHFEKGNSYYILGFENGAKWQEQRIIEEVFEWLTSKDYLTDLKETLIENFNKFKKK